MKNKIPLFCGLMLKLIIVCLNVSKSIQTTNCSQGWFFDGTACSKCDDSCKTCTNEHECSTCEDSMYIDLTNGLCRFCDEGYYFDSTHNLCRNCDGICSKLCAYQTTCFQCTSNQFFDTDLLSCVTDCPSPKIKVSNSQYILSHICRSNEIYINPSSTEIIELGTNQYPYKTAKAAFSELLNSFSHKQINITIFIKEFTTLYIQDDTNFILNMTSVKITSYSDITNNPSKATIIPTQNLQQGLSKRSAFNLLKTSDLWLNQTLQSSTFSDSQKLLILKGGVNFLIAKSSLYFDNVDVRREASDVVKDTIFIFPLYLSSMWIDVRNSNLNLTGTIVFTMDPLNANFENLQFDTANLINGFYFPINCNYPEASLANSISFTNITTFSSTNRNLYLSPKLIFNSGPGNFTCKNVNIQNYGTSFQDYTMSATYYTSSNCQPNDNMIQSINFESWSLSMPNLPAGTDLLNGISIYSDYSPYRKIIANISSIQLNDFVPAYGSVITATGTFNQEIYLYDLSITNFSLLNSFISIRSFKSVIINGVQYSGCTGAYASSLLIDSSSNVELRNIQFDNYTYRASSSVNPMISLNNFNTTQTWIDSISVSNTILYYASVVQFLNELNNLTVSNFSFKNISVSEGNSMISAVKLQTLAFLNHTYSAIYTLDDSDDSSSILYVGSFDLAKSSNSSLSNIDISNCEVAMLKFNGITNTPLNTASIKIQNMSFTDSYFKASKSLINVSNLESNVKLNLIFSSLVFDNISFKTNGYLLLLMHQLPTQLVIESSTFTNLKSAGIKIEASNKQDKLLSTQVLIEDSLFTNINDETNSLINIFEGGNLTINNCTFVGVFTYEEGAVLYAGSQKTLTTIKSSVFKNNTAVTGAIFYIESQSKVQLYDCIFMDNFAISSTIVYTTESGYFEFYRSSIKNTYALANPISIIFNSVTGSKINNCDISSNYGLTLKSINLELYSSCSNLCYVPDLFKQYLKNHPKLLQISSSKALFQILYASLSISNSTTISSTNTLICEFTSSVTIENSKISDIQVVETSIEVTTSSLSMTNVTLSVVSNTNNYDFIVALMSSTVNFSNCSYLDSTSDLINIRNSVLSVIGFTFNRMYSGGPMIVASECTNITFKNIVTLNTDSNQKYIYQFAKSSNIVIYNVNAFSLMNKSIFSILSSNVTSMDRLNITLCMKAAYISNSNIQIISNSQFVQNGKPQLEPGGGLRIIDSKISIINTKFIRDAGKNGGGISFECSSFDVCYLSLTNIVFDSNRVDGKGGAIYYDYNRPFFNNVKFIGNIAGYGNDIASYPVKVRLNNKPNEFMSFNDIISGVPFNSLKLTLLDYDDQINLLEDTSQVMISAVDYKKVSVNVNNFASSQSGVITVNNLVLTAKPGSLNVPLDISSKSIDMIKVNKVFGPNMFPNIVFANFTYCKSGQIELSDYRCSTCSPGSYSVGNISTSCSTCLNFAECLGGNQIYVDSGYWRRTINSIKIVKCINPEACLGGFVDQEYAPVNCKEGYGGDLCTECQLSNGAKFQRVSDFGCSKCPDMINNTLRVFGVGFVVFIFISCIIILNIKKTTESQLSVLLRIFTNYIQLVSIPLSFTITYPSAISNFFSVFSEIGSSSDTFLSFDCFIMDYDIKGPFPSNKILKLFLSLLLPIFLTVIFIIIWLLLYVFRRRWFPDLKRSILISFITIVFFLHPKLTQSSISAFQCVEIDENDLRARVDTSIKCYSFEHIKWCLLIGMPIILIWVTSCPIIALVLIFKNYKESKSNKVKIHFLVLYQGLKQEKFYWEFVNTLRKVLILLSFCFLATFSNTYQIAVAVIILIVSVRIQIWLEPYKESYNNEIEILGMTSGIVFISSGLVFSQNYSYPMLNFIFLILVISINTIFVIKWVLLLTFCLGEKSQFFLTISKSIAIITFNRKYFDFLLQNQEKSENEIQSHSTSQKYSDGAKDIQKINKSRNRRKILKTKFKRKSKQPKIEKDTKNSSPLQEEFSKLGLFEEEKEVKNCSKNFEELTSKAKSYLIDDYQEPDSSYSGAINMQSGTIREIVVNRRKTSLNKFDNSEEICEDHQDFMNI